MNKEYIIEKKIFVLNKIIMFFALAIVINLFVTLSAFAATYYVSPSGSDSSGDGSSGNPWNMVDYGISMIASGDTLILKDGTYTIAKYGVGGRAKNQIASVPSGTPGNYSIIKAENDGGAVITGGASSNYSPIEIIGGQYIQIEGLTFKETTSADNCIKITSANHIKLLKIGIKNGAKVTTYANIIVIGGSSEYVLLEDCWIVGNMRYGIQITDPVKKTILRRCVVRPDWVNSSQPKSAYCIYGGKDTTSPNTDNIPVRDVLVQNCIAIDNNPGDWYRGYIYGGFNGEGYQHDNTFQGCIALNIRGTVSTGTNGLIGFKQYTLAGTAYSQGGSFDNCVAWDINGSGFYWGEALNTGHSYTDNVTAGVCGTGVYSRGSSNRSKIHITDSIFYNNNGKNVVGSAGYTLFEEQDNNFYDPASLAEGTNTQTGSSGFQYIVRTPQSGYGATIEMKSGTDGTLWGDSGYNTLTSSSLWPFPSEDRIKSLFSETNNPPSGAYPTTNDANRGFCATGNDAFGQPMTLSRYIWQYLGNEIPAYVYGAANDTTPPTAPTGLQVL